MSQSIGLLKSKREMAVFGYMKFQVCLKEVNINICILFELVNNLKGPRIFLLRKVHIFREGHKILRTLHRRFDRYYIEQIYSGDFAKFCGLLRIYELYLCVKINLRWPAYQKAEC
jgi:hypothetical protein